MCGKSSGAARLAGAAGVELATSAVTGHRELETRALTGSTTDLCFRRQALLVHVVDSFTSVLHAES